MSERAAPPSTGGVSKSVSRYELILRVLCFRNFDWGIAPQNHLENEDFLKELRVKNPNYENVYCSVNFRRQTGPVPTSLKNCLFLSVATPADSRCEKKSEIALEIVFEIAGAKCRCKTFRQLNRA